MTEPAPTAADTIRKSMSAALAAPSEDIARSVLASAGADPSTLEKTITTATGLVAYDLQAPSKALYPAATPIRNRLPRVQGGTGTATNWRQVNSLIGSGFDAMGWVPEGQRAGFMSYSTTSRAAAYATLGEEDTATFEAINAARYFEDVQASMALRLLQKTMLKEEMALLAGNATLQLGVPAQPAASAGGTGATLPSATYSVIVVALTLEGMRNSSLAAGVATTQTITGADGKTFTLNGGASARSANRTQAITLGQTLSATVAPVTGAVAYAWFVGAAGAETLQAITPINSVAIAAPLAAGMQAASTITSDYSTNSGAFDGLLTTALKPGSNAYVKTMATGTAGAGTVLTSSGQGSVVEIDDMLQGMWDTAQVSPTVLYVNSRQLRDISAKCLNSASGPLLNYFVQAGGAPQLTTGGVIEFYYNPFLLDGGVKIPIKIHPNVPPGVILGWCEDLPAQYQNSETPNVAEVVGTCIRFAGRVSEIKSLGRTQAVVSAASWLDLLSTRLPADVYQSACLNALGDARCGVALAAFAVNGTVAAGTATQTGFPTALTQPAGWFELGKVVFTGGVNVGLARTVKSFDGSGAIQLVSPLPSPPAAGDAFTAYPGCALSMADCQGKFANLARFRGQPFVPAPSTGLPT